MSERLRWHAWTVEMADGRLRTSRLHVCRETKTGWMESRLDALCGTGPMWDPIDGQFFTDPTEAERYGYTPCGTCYQRYSHMVAGS